MALLPRTAASFVLLRRSGGRSGPDQAQAGGEARPAVLLATVIADPHHRRLALAAVIASIAAFLAAVPFARVPLTPVPAFIPAYEASLVVVDLITAVLLFGQFAQLRSAASRLAASRSASTRTSGPTRSGLSR